MLLKVYIGGRKTSTGKISRKISHLWRDLDGLENVTIRGDPLYIMYGITEHIRSAVALSKPNDCGFFPVDRRLWSQYRRFAEIRSTNAITFVLL